RVARIGFDEMIQVEKGSAPVRIRAEGVDVILKSRRSLLGGRPLLDSREQFGVRISPAVQEGVNAGAAFVEERASGLRLDQRVQVSESGVPLGGVLALLRLALMPGEYLVRRAREVTRVARAEALPGAELGRDWLRLGRGGSIHTVAAHELDQ